jgi:proteasome lid subunit RPN8/RPN11
VIILRAALDGILSHARECRPAECCGLMLGRAGTIQEAVPAPNVADDPTREYVLDPETHFRTRRDARGRDLVVMGFYHSHPHSLPEPSERDVQEAFYPEALYVIAGQVGDADEVRMYRFDGSRFVQVDWRIVE